MKSTILNLNDRLNNFFKQSKSDVIHQYHQMVKSLPLDKIEKHWDNFVENVTKKINDDFLDQIEMLNLQLKDHEEAARVLNDINTNLTLRQKEVQLKLDDAEQQIVTLNRGLIIEIRNRDHFRSIITGQDIIVKEMNKKMEAYTSANREVKNLRETQAIHKLALETKTKEAEHLATQLIRLHQENSELHIKNIELKTITEFQADSITKLKPYVNKLAEKWFPPAGVDYTLLCVKANDVEVSKVKTIRIPNNQLNLPAVPPPDLKSTPESCCESKIEKDVISLKVGDKVRVPVRFGETGIIVEIKPTQENTYGVKFQNLFPTLFYKAEELQLLGPNEKGFYWFRMPEREKLQDELQVLTKTYHPKGFAEVPSSVPKLVSGVSPSIQPGGRSAIIKHGMASAPNPSKVEMSDFEKFFQTNSTKTHEESMDEFDHHNARQMAPMHQ